MKIAYASDIHLEFGQIEFHKFENTGADVLVLAGDIIVANSMNHHIYNPFFQHISKQFKHVLYVMGNHEHYHGDFQQSAAKIKQFIHAYPNIRLLDNESVLIDGIRFFGATMWTNMNDRDPYVMEYVGRHMNDFRVVMNGNRAFKTADAVIEYTQSLTDLEIVLQGQDEKVVVISHHSPSVLSVHPRYKYDTEMNYGYHSRLEPLMMKYPKIVAWCHGHVHDTFDYYIGETRVVCNPRGYVNLESLADEFELKYIEV